jgi:hypothetical protein
VCGAILDVFEEVELHIHDCEEGEGEDDEEGKTGEGVAPKESINSERREGEEENRTETATWNVSGNSFFW